MRGKDQDPQAVDQAFGHVFEPEWPRIEEALAASLVGFTGPIPEAHRRQVETGFCGRADVRRYDPRNPDDAAMLAREFCVYACEQVATYRMRDIVAGNVDLKRLRRASRRRLPKAKDQPYQSEKARARNLELVAFVSERIIPFMDWCEGKIAPGHRGPAIRTPWDELAKEWNQTHARGYESGKTMARAYYRAIDPGARPIYREYQRQIRSELRDVLEEHERELEEVVRALWGTPALSPENSKKVSDTEPGLVARLDSAMHLRKITRNGVAHGAAVYRSLPERLARKAVGQFAHSDVARRCLSRRSLISDRVWGLHVEGPAAREREHGRTAPLRHWFLAGLKEQASPSDQSHRSPFSSSATVDIGQSPGSGRAGGCSG